MKLNKLTQQMLRCKANRKVNLERCQQMYYCCDEHDMAMYFAVVVEHLLEIRKNAVFWYRDIAKHFKVTDEFLDDLRKMQLFVIPVTACFLREDNPARNVELSFAIFNQIPVLPLMQEEGLEEEYHRLCMTIRFLEKNTTLNDLIRRSYDKMLGDYLRATVVNNEQASRICEAFDAYIFLNYRRRSREDAETLMPLIYNNEFCGGDGFWEDKELSSDENFSNALKGIAEKSTLFTMIIPPSQIEDEMVYYEYAFPFTFGSIFHEDSDPDAADAKMVEKMFRGITNCFPSKTVVHIATFIHELLWNIALQEKEDEPVHHFMTGLAYLYGFNVEVNFERAVSLISGAASAGLLEAHEKLVSMYWNGEGVEKSYLSAIEWQQRYVECLQKEAEKDQSILSCMRVFHELLALCDYQEESQQFADATETCKKMMKWAEKLKEAGFTKANQNMAMAYEKMGDICMAQGKAKEAKDWYKKAEDLS